MSRSNRTRTYRVELWLAEGWRGGADRMPDVSVLIRAHDATEAERRAAYAAARAARLPRVHVIDSTTFRESTNPEANRRLFVRSIGGAR